MQGRISLAFDEVDMPISVDFIHDDWYVDPLTNDEDPFEAFPGGHE